MTRMPPLTALRVFSVAGKLKSFSKAAEELHITQGAVSRQIRNLEEDLNIKLFHRLTRQIELTPIGRQYHQDIQEAFRLIEKTTHQLLNQKSAILKINALPSVSSYVLMPNLSDFSQTYPKVELRLENSIDSVDFHSGTTDIAIRVGPHPDQKYQSKNPSIDLRMVTDWEGISTEFLAKDLLVPIYSSKYSEEPLDLTDPCILKEQTLIHTSSRSAGWEGWFQMYHQEDLPMKTRNYLEYSHFFMSLESAKSGLGIALVPDILLNAEKHQHLHVHKDLSVRSSGDYYLLYLKNRQNDFEIQAFIDWCKNLFIQLKS